MCVCVRTGGAGPKWLPSCGSWSKSCRENETSGQFTTIIYVRGHFKTVTHKHTHVKHTHLCVWSECLHHLCNIFIADRTNLVSFTMKTASICSFTFWYFSIQSEVPIMNCSVTHSSFKLISHIISTCHKPASSIRSRVLVYNLIAH